MILFSVRNAIRSSAHCLRFELQSLPSNVTVILPDGVFFFPPFSFAVDDDDSDDGVVAAAAAASGVHLKVPLSSALS